MSEDPNRRIVREIERAGAAAKAEIGVCAMHIESGRQIAVNAKARFPMASTYKIPIAMRLLSLVEHRALGLDDLIEVTKKDLSPGSGVIQEFLLAPGVRLSVRNLLGLALRLSDNTASDIVLRLAGGPRAVTAFIREQGITDMRIDRSTKRILSDFYGFVGAPSDENWSLEEYRKSARATTDRSRAAAAKAFLKDTRDSCTPTAMCSLLVLLHRGCIVSRKHTDLLLQIMRDCRTGPNRLKGMLPAEIVVAHKTGSALGGVVADVGIIALPDRGGDIAIAAFVKGAGAAIEVYERAIAHAARYVFDYFLITTSE